MSTTTTPKGPTRPGTDRGGERRPAELRFPSRKRTRYTALEIAGAGTVALGVALIANAALGVSNVLVLGLVAYAGFVALVAAAELSGNRARPAPEVIDLSAEAPPELRAEAAAAEMVRADSPALHTVPEPEPVDLPDAPMRRRVVSGAEIVEALVAALAAAALAEIVRVALHMRSVVGLGLWWYVAFIASYYLLARDHDDAETALDRVVTMLVWSVGLVLIAALVWMLTSVVTSGAGKLTWGFLTHDLSKTGPLDPGGGAFHAIVGTVEQVGLATIIVVPVGILTAVYLHEIRGPMARPIRFIVDAMSGLPSIVAGLLIYTVWVSGHGFSGAAGSAALVVLMLPTMTRATEEILRTVPDSLREGALALGSPQWRLVQRVVLPTALAGIVTATLLSVAHAIGETAPMLLTAFGADATNANPFHGPQSDLPLFIFKLIFQPNQTDHDRAWTGALILVLFVLVLFVSARLVARRGLRRLGGTR